MAAIQVTHPRTSGCPTRTLSTMVFSRKSDLPVKNSQTFSEPSPTFLRLPKLPPKLPQAFPSFPHHFPTFRGTFPSFPSVSAACQCLPRQSRAVRGNPSLAPPLPPSHNPPSSLLFLPTDPHTPMEPRSKPRDAHLSHPECERASASAPGWVSKEGPYGGASCGVGGCRCVWWWQGGRVRVCVWGWEGGGKQLHQWIQYRAAGSGKTAGRPDEEAVRFEGKQGEHVERQLEREGLGAWVRAVPITRQQAGQPLLRC